MRVIVNYPLLTAAAFSISCSAAPPALRVGTERDVTQMDAAVRPTEAPALTPPPQLNVPDASAKHWASLELSIEGAAASGELSVCRGECLDVDAKAEGGNPPYMIAWDDGSTLPQRHVCPQADTLLTANVKDTAIDSAEFAYVAQQQTASAHIVVRECSAKDAGQMTKAAAAKSCGATAATACVIAPGISLPDEVEVDVPGATARPFAKGVALPAGRYRVEYVDGCNSYGLGCDWTVHGSKEQPGTVSCFLVGDGNVILGLTPGTAGVFADQDPDLGGAFKTYDECVAANCKEPPLDFDFAGGTLSVQRDGGGALGAVDDATGASEGGRAPTFRLTRLDPCD